MTEGQDALGKPGREELLKAIAERLLAHQWPPNGLTLRHAPGSGASSQAGGPPVECSQFCLVARKLFATPENGCIRRFLTEPSR